MVYSHVSPAGTGSEDGPWKGVNADSKGWGGKQDLESHLGAARLVTARSQGADFEVFSSPGGLERLSVVQLECSLNKERKHCHLMAPSAAWTLGYLGRWLGGGHLRGKRGY